MFKFSLATLTSAMAVSAVLVASVPSAQAGDLGDGGYGARSYGSHRPYFSGQPDFNGQDDGGDRYSQRQDYGASSDDGDDDDDGINGQDGDQDGDQSGDNDDGDDRQEHHAYRHEGSTKDDDYRAPPHRAGCVPGWKVKQRLIGEGWSNFKLSTYGRGEAIVRATRVHTGRRFELRLDGCTGQTLSSYPLDGNRRYSFRN